MNAISQSNAILEIDLNGKIIETNENFLEVKWNDFKQLRKELDPTNKFLNNYLTVLFNEQ